MKILYISPENTVGTLSTWKKFHESQNHQCDFITFYKTANGFDSGICLNLPFVSTGSIYKAMRSVYYNTKYGKNGEYSIKPGNPPVWQATKYWEKKYFQMRDKIWKKIIDKRLRHINLFDFDVYHFEWGLDFYRDCSFAQQVAAMGKPIICTYHGQDLRTRGVVEPLNSLSNLNLTSELDLLSLHSEMEYMFLPINLNKNQIIKKTGLKIRICHSPTNRYYKGSEKIIETCEQIKKNHKNIEFILIEKMNHKDVLKLKKTCDIVIDQIGNYGGWGYGMNSIESMALGLCCMTEMNNKCIQFYKDHPFININKDNLKEKIIDLISHPDKIDHHKNKALNWALEKHRVNKVGKILYHNYEKILNG